jgi:hypothetical protein
MKRLGDNGYTKLDFVVVIWSIHSIRTHTMIDTGSFGPILVLQAACFTWKDMYASYQFIGASGTLDIAPQIFMPKYFPNQVQRYISLFLSSIYIHTCTYTLATTVDIHISQHHGHMFDITHVQPPKTH